MASTPSQPASPPVAPQIGRGTRGSEGRKADATDVGTAAWLHLKRVSALIASNRGGSRELTERFLSAQQKAFQAALRFITNSTAFTSQLSTTVARLTSQNNADATTALNIICEHVRALGLLGAACHASPVLQSVFSAVERILVALQGHPRPSVRSLAVVELTALDDRHGWQRAAAFEPVICTAGAPLKLRVEVASACVPTSSDAGTLAFLVAAPAASDAAREMAAACGVLDATAPFVTVLDVSISDAPESGVCVVSAATAPVKRAGFYDWCLVCLPPGGEPSVVTLAAGGPAQGRFIAHPQSIRGSGMLEVVVDLEGLEYDDARGKITRRGTFHDVASKLPDYARRGVSHVFVVGTLERDNGFLVEQRTTPSPQRQRQRQPPRVPPAGGGGEWGFFEGDSGTDDEANLAAVVGAAAAVVARPEASPFALTSRSTPCRMLGGGKGFRRLLTRAAQRDIGVLVQLEPCVSASRPHRRYTGLIAQTLNDQGAVVFHPGTDGRENQWEDQALPNYRKVEAWDVLVEDVLALANAGVGGVVVSDCQSLPLIMAVDEHEMHRLDVDGVPHYSPYQILTGEVVLPNTEIGYWKSRAAKRLPNPLLVRTVRRVWASAPEFVLLGDCHWGRGAAVARSGVVPRLNTLDAVAATVNRAVSKDGVVSVNNAPRTEQPVDLLRRAVKQDCKFPPGALNLAVRCMCSARTPYPALVLHRHAWTAVDALVCLPGVPMTFMDEDRGRAYRVSLHNVNPDNAQLVKVDPHQAMVRRLTVNPIQRSSSDVDLISGAFEHTSGDLLTPTLNKRRNNSTVSLSALSSRDDATHPVEDWARSVSYPRGAQAVGADPSWHAQAPMFAQYTAGGGGRVPTRDAADDDFATHLVVVPGEPTTAGRIGAGVGAGAGSGAGGALPDLSFAASWPPPAATVARNRSDGSTGSALDGGDGVDVDSPKIPSVTSWSAFPTAGDTAGVVSVEANDKLRDITTLEARHRQNVGPEFGWDLNLIAGHYEHRRGVRRQLTVLQQGETMVLDAYHREGPHGNVFAFARFMEDEIAIVACNFNTSPSTFWVDNSPLAAAFGAKADASTQATATSILADERHAAAEGAAARPTSSLLDHIWEESDAFKNQAHLRVMTASEAAYSHRTATLAPHASMCWLFKRQRAADAAWVEAGSAGADTAPPSHEQLMRYALYSSSLKCLESVLMKDRHKAYQASAASFNPGNQTDDQLAAEGAEHTLVYALLQAALLDDAAAADAEVAATARDKPTAAAPPAPRAPAEEVAMPMVPSPPAASATPAAATPVPAAPTSPGAEGAASQSPTRTASLYYALRVLVREFGLSVDGEGKCVHSGVNVRRVTPYVTGHVDTYTVDAKSAASIIRVALFLICQSKNIEPALALRELVRLATLVPASEAASSSDSAAATVSALSRLIVASNELGAIVFVAPELGKWSTVGGLGVMVDELTVGLAELGAKVAVVSPFYQQDRKGRTDYLKYDGILYSGRTVAVQVGPYREECGVHTGRVKGVDLFFIHHPAIFPKPYPAGDAKAKLLMLSTFARATLETLCQFRYIPKLVITNDWFAGLVPAYARYGAFGNAFVNTRFLHIAHNLDTSYEGRLYPAVEEKTLDWLHNLPTQLLVDPFWGGSPVLNPTRAALLCSNSWATVSKSYRADLLASSPLAPLLKLAPQPFAHPNGIPTVTRVAKLMALEENTHDGAEAVLQRRYFGMEPDMGIPMFGFVGRITSQKGVHLMLESVDDLVRRYHGRVQFIIGGMASMTDPYGRSCASMMHDLRARYPTQFWADPSFFFTDGPSVNLGCDFGMMPSAFEPGGIVQQEFHVAGTPVVAFRTGGLKDTVREYNVETGEGNGLCFLDYSRGDFVDALTRAVDLFGQPEVYARLRRAARASVVDLSTVSRGWFTECYRLRQCLLDRPTVRFIYATGHDGPIPSSVQVVGTFNAWNLASHPMRWVAQVKEYQVCVPLPAGDHEFKFVVDGEWVVSQGYATTKDSQGNVNNVITIAEQHL